MTALELLAHLRSLNIQLSIDGQNLRLNAPEGVVTPSIRAQLAEHKAEILALLQQSTMDSTTEIRSTGRTDRLPLAFAQLRLWFLDQLNGPSAQYNVPAAWRIRGPLDMPALESSLAEVIRRHQILRARIVLAGGAAVQSIMPQQDVFIPLVDLTGLPVEERSAQLERILAQEATRPFVLNRDSFVRPVLVRLNATDHVLLVVMHHIVCDAWSIEILTRELGNLYGAFLEGQPSPLPDLTVQYADFVDWQRQWLRGEVLESRLGYWRKQLADAPAVLALPTDRPRPAVRTWSAGVERFVVESGLDRLEALARQEGATLYMTLLAVFAALLARYSEQQDIVVGSPVANRNRQELELLMGFFVNTLALRVDLSGNPTFRQLLRRVRETTLDALDHQDLPFEKLVEVLKPERDLSITPLFQVVLALQNAPAPVPDLAGLKVSAVEIDSEMAKFDLTLEMIKSAQGLTGRFIYSTDLFDATTIARMARHLRVLLSAVIAHPDEHLLQLPLLDQAERQQILDWNNTRTDYPPNQLFHELFEERVDQAPDSTAVIFQKQEWTYGELNRRANQLAHYLRRLGVGPEVLVGIYLNRSPNIPLSWLATLKAGGVYLPLDPTYPAARIAYMMQDANVSVLLTTHDLTGVLPPHRAQMVCLDSDWSTIDREPVDNLDRNVTMDHLAYVIYTSGSTGKPKGVLLTHRGLANLPHAEIRGFELDARDRILQFSSLSFDASVYELCMALGSGAALCMATQNDLLPGKDLIRLLRDGKVTMVTLPPSTLAALPQVDIAALRNIAVAGEACPPSVVEKWASGRNFYNLYGPTETTVWATAARCSEHDERVSIGRPIDNAQAYVLDALLQPAPVGVPGELYIGGVGLARGYLNRPALTAEKFIPNPFGDRPGDRLYKTGDRVRYLADGNIEFMGRVDDQVKIRGFRIELAEIKAVLGQYPGVRDATAIVREDQPGDQRLVAYYVAAGESIPERGELGRFLSDRLPDYMVPSALVELEVLPLMPNGKVDRHALPIPDMSKFGTARPFTAPRNQIEAVVAGIWSEILGLEEISVTDDFMDLGGHSLLVPRVLYRIQETFAIEVSARSFLENSSVAGLAVLIEKIQKNGHAAATAGQSEFDLEAEAVLDPAIHAVASSARLSQEPRAVFLTGATGFVGIFILHELLRQTHADVYCLVRASNLQLARERIQKRLECSGLDTRASSRIIPVVGNLSLPNLGLAPEHFESLGRRVDAIYHCGAWVNFVNPYSKLKPANVLGTQEILRLACQDRAVPVHYISTLSVFNGSPYHNRVLSELDVLKTSEGLKGGYAQSKWVAEKLAVEAGARGLPVSIYRLGVVTGDSHTGVSNTKDFICRFLAGSIQLGSMPDLRNVWYMAPVDYVSRAVVQLSRLPASLGKVYHIVSSHPLFQNQMLDWTRNFGYDLKRAPFEQWLDELVKVAGNSPDHALYPLLSFLKETGPGDAEESLADSHNTLAALNGTGIACPPIDARIFGLYLDYFITTGFLPPPGMRSRLYEPAIPCNHD